MFEPRTRASTRKRLLADLLGLALWVGFLALVVLSIATDKMVTDAFEVAGACFVFALVMLSLNAVLRHFHRRRGAMPSVERNNR